ARPSTDRRPRTSCARGPSSRATGVPGRALPGLPSWRRDSPIESDKTHGFGLRESGARIRVQLLSGLHSMNAAFLALLALVPLARPIAVEDDSQADGNKLVALELLADHNPIQPGSTFTLALRCKIERRWH